MVSRTQKFRLGIFLVITSVLLVIFFVIIAGNRLMEKRDHYLITYQGVSVIGLQIGSQVKYYGIAIGSVDDITIDKNNINNVIVEISVKEGTPIKEDVQATLVPVGITGLKQIELMGGTNAADFLEPGSEISPGVSTYDNITGKAEIIAEKLEMLLNNLNDLTTLQNRRRMSNILFSADTILQENRKLLNLTISNLQLLLQENRKMINTTLTNFNNFITETREPASKILARIDSVSVSLTLLSKEANSSIDRVNAILESDQIDSILQNSEDFTSHLADIDLISVIDNLNSTINNANDTFTHLDLTLVSGRKDLLATLETLKETVAYLNEFSRQISEDPSILLRSKK